MTNGGVLGGQVIDDNETPSVGWQFGFDAGDAVGLFLGGNHGASGQNGNKDWEHFFDLVLTANVDFFTLIFNGDYQLNPNEKEFDPTSGATLSSDLTLRYGHSLALIFDVADKVSIGVRGEHLSGNQRYLDLGGDDYGGLATGTLTLRIKPAQFLVISVEGRGEWATRQIYFSRAATTDAMTGELVANKKHNYAAIIGMTAYIGN